MKKKPFVSLVLASILTEFIACTSNIDLSIINSDAPLIEAIKAENSWLGLSNVGNTTIRVRPDTEVLPEKPAKAPDLSKIQKEAGKFRLVSVGGALSAGFRDGGLYREGQLTAFPNLVARQMGVSFVQPLFSEAEGNGTGYKTVAGTAGPLVKFNMVTNNLGVIQRNGETAYTDFGDKDKVEIDQMAFPEIPKGLQYYHLINPKNKSYKYIDQVVNEAIKSRHNTPSRWVEAQNADLFIIELGSDDTYFAISAGGGSISGSQGLVATSPEFLLIKSLTDKKNKAVLLNVPNLLEVPYFQQISEEKIKKSGLELLIQTNLGSNNYRPYNASVDRIIINDKTGQLFNGGIKGVVKLQDEDVISEAYSDPEITMVSPESYNTFEIERQAQLLNLPVVDIYSLYKRILAGNYVTDDGVAVSPAWPKNGNFFSADGIYPTAFGQAVIANEVIKTLNRHYGLEIPLLQTRFFVGK
ncbi:hypothetical protein DR864_16150 [Runella rosea]|uniref:GDSL-like Lipase/Acylhydrolase n=1 Tax=Runella rosea TaxID=2259595 RepID=A0A344TKK4_9BACT|nr:hypothetical protein [Runella rosea]AXE19175.1 hypothetical protein DR864_16150 [Runella rosea]